jgi:hypothetical protein
MNAEKLTAEKTIHWLNKTADTAYNMPDGPITDRKTEIARRYNELKGRASELSVWVKYCATKGYSLDHEGYDLFA